jgi:hypothetical protein
MMQHATQWLSILAARQDMHRVWGRFDHGRSGINTSHAVTFLGALALLALVLFAWHCLSRPAARKFSCDSSRRLFRELCGAHRLNLSRRRLLKRLASARQIADPAMLFLQPEYFETTSLPAHLESSTVEIQKLHDRLFE